MKRIDFETHFVTDEFVKTLMTREGYPRYRIDEKTKLRRLWYAPDVGEPMADVLLEKLLDLGEGRLKRMNEAGIDVQVLSLTSPGVEHFEPELGTALAKRTNDLLSETIKKHPDRFMGLAALAPKDPRAAADELERAVKTLGLKGWKTHSNYGDTYLDNKKYWPILEVAEKLDVPVFLHPAVPLMPELRAYGFAMGGAAFGFGFDTALCMMRLVFGGVFDRFPRLKVIVGHLGEGLPFLVQRVDFAYVRPWIDSDARPALAKKPSDYLKENMFVGTSGNYLVPAFMCTHQALGVERIVLATDYPYEDSDECIRFIEGMPIPEADKLKIYYQNASQLGFTV